MIKSKGILTVSIISLFAVESAYAAIASSGYVDQQVETRISEVVEAGDGNVVSSISTEGTKVTATKGITAEVTSNKTTSIAAAGSASDTKYPSEKAVATALDAKQDKLEGEVLTNTATGSGSLSTGGANAIATNNSVAIGPGSTAGDASVSVGNNARSASSAIVIGSGSSLGNNVVIGTNAYGTGSDAVSIGKGAYSNTKSVAIGSGAKTQDASNMIAIGNLAKTSADYAIQLGDGTNSEANTLSVGLSGANNYKLLGSDGKIPAERLPFTGDVLTNTATGSNSVSTGGANVTTGSLSLAIGVDAATGSSGEVAVGAAATSGGYSSVAVGNAADATGGNAVAVGQNSLADSMNSTAVGQGAKSTATYAIQLGAGTNSEANTFSVGLGSGKNYKLLGSDGKIPADRLPVATSSTLGGVKSGGDISISSTGAVSVVSALKAVQDANGANIAATYATKASLNDLNNNKVQKDWTTSNVNKVLVIGSDSNYPDVYGKVTVAKITENFLDNAIKNKLSNAVTSVATSGSGAVVTGFSKSGNSMTVTKSNVKIPVGSATATTYATIWVE